MVLVTVRATWTMVNPDCRCILRRNVLVTGVVESGFGPGELGT
jgi:hypothetical protein